MPSLSIARVVFNLPLESSFDYRIPPEWLGRVRVGQRVVAPFGRRRLIGYVTGLARTSAVPAARLRAFLRLLDERPWFTPDLLRLGAWLTRQCGVSLGEALAAIVPARLPAHGDLPRQAGLPALRHVEAAEAQQTGLPALRHVEAAEAQQTGLPALRHVEAAEAQQAGMGPCTGAPTAILPPEAPPCGHAAAPVPSIRPLIDAVCAKRFRVIALEAEDAAMRWNACEAAIDAALAGGRTALWLAPDIGAAAVLQTRGLRRWGDRVALLHGRTTPRRRADIYARVQGGAVRLIIGTRSAVFAPLPSLGALILDEEQEAGYKQSETPAYHARAVALERARAHRALVVLAGATLSVETWQAATAGRYGLVRLASRRDRAARCEVFDVRHQKRGWPVIFTVALEEAVRRTLERRGQVLLVLNRRGFATWVHCKRCKTVLRCPQCRTGLVYHFARKELVCHTCQSRHPAPDICPACQGRYLRYQGLGTEKVVSETCRLFPAARVARLDRDLASAGTRVVEETAARLARGEIDVLVGTQLVHRLPAAARVALVGVISADAALHVPDFRAGERTFALLRQAAARATERLIIQTAVPEHEAIRAVQRQDAARFYRDELRARRLLGLPPFRRLVRLLLAGDGEATPATTAAALAERLRSAAAPGVLEVIGPAPATGQQRGQRLWQLVLKGKRWPPLLAAVGKVIGPQRRFEGTSVRVDVDPY